jgi:hypothetical protein
MLRILLAIIITLLSAVTACVQVAAPSPVAPTVPQSTPPSSPPPAGYKTPVIVIFEASPSSIAAGSAVTLNWEITNASSVSINQGLGSVALKGNRAVTPSSTITYTISATNQYGSSTASTQVIVKGSPPIGTPSSFNLPVVAIFTAEPANIMSGSTAILKWEVQNSFDIDIAPGLSIIPPKGSREISPAFPTTYILTARNAQGSIIATTTLTVSGVPPDAETPVIKYFTATPYVIKKGESATLSWQSAGGSSASIDKGVGTIDGSGTVRVTPESTTTYMLTVVNPRGGQFQTTTVNVK